MRLLGDRECAGLGRTWLPESTWVWARLSDRPIRGAAWKVVFRRSAKVGVSSRVAVPASIRGPEQTSGTGFAERLLPASIFQGCICQFCLSDRTRPSLVSRGRRELASTRSRIGPFAIRRRARSLHQTGACATGRLIRVNAGLTEKSPRSGTNRVLCMDFWSFWHRGRVPLSRFPRLLIFSVRKAAQKTLDAYI